MQESNRKQFAEFIKNPTHINKAGRNLLHQYLMFAEQQLQTDTVWAIIEAGVSVNKVDNQQKSPLRIAVMQ